MVRAVLEGCAFAMLDVLDHFKQMGVAADSLLLLGGVSVSALIQPVKSRFGIWTRIQVLSLVRPFATRVLPIRA